MAFFLGWWLPSIRKEQEGTQTPLGAKPWEMGRGAAEVLTMPEAGELQEDRDISDYQTVPGRGQVLRVCAQQGRWCGSPKAGFMYIHVFMAGC